MKTLCLYYSRTGSTKKAMELLARITQGELFEYTDGRDRSGLLGYLGACLASMRKSFPRVSIQGNPDLAAYDRVIIGMPVWAEGPCVVGRALLAQFGQELPKEVYYVVTHMAKNDYMAKIRALDRLLGRPCSGQVSVQTKGHDYLQEIRAFGEGLAKQSESRS